MTPQPYSFMEELMRKYALQNAVKFKGRANLGAVVGKVLQEKPELKAEAPKIKAEAIKIVEEVNNMSLEDQEKALTNYSFTEKKKEVKKGLKDMPFADDFKKVVMRFAPSPSGPLHIGHNYVLSLNYLYAKKYKGKIILRIEDTNPSNIYEKAYDLIPEDAQWLCENGIDEVLIQSDRMDIYYGHALKLIEEGHAYVCTCAPDDFKSLMSKKMPCPCRDLSEKENTKRWHKMFDKEKGFKEGEAVVRFKSDYKHKNPAMRDFPLLRINDEEHPRTGNKYRVWPLMNFSVSMDDMELGITHAVRGKDHADNAKRQELIHHIFKHRTPVAVSVGRINFTGGFPVSATKTKEKIEAGEIKDWDDIRIPFLGALRRRGYQAGALRKYAEEVGISKADKTVTMEEFFKTMNAFNKDLLEEKANRYFFIQDPVEITIENAPDLEIELDLHPELRKKGRHFHTNDKFFITKEDFDNLKDKKLYRLMDCLNFRKEGDKFVFVSTDLEDYKKNGESIMHWLPSNDTIKVSVVMQDNKTIKGVGEKLLNDLKQGDIIQFERFAFCKLDNSDEMKFWYTHK